MSDCFKIKSALENNDFEEAISRCLKCFKTQWLVDELLSYITTRTDYETLFELLKQNLRLSYREIGRHFTQLCYKKMKTHIQYIWERSSINFEHNKKFFDNLFINICESNFYKSAKRFQKLCPYRYYVIIGEDSGIDYAYDNSPFVYTYKAIIDYGINKIEDTNKTVSVAKIDTCSVCQDSTSDIMTNCNHQYCKSCILKWLEKNATCPMCRNNNITIMNIIQE